MVTTWVEAHHCVQRDVLDAARPKRVATQRGLATIAVIDGVSGWQAVTFIRVSKITSYSPSQVNGVTSYAWMECSFLFDFGSDDFNQ